jgi:hypothetical protein
MIVLEPLLVDAPAEVFPIILLPTQRVGFRHNCTCRRRDPRRSGGKFISPVPDATRLYVHHIAAPLAVLSKRVGLENE